MQTKAGGQTLRQTMIKKHGSLENWKKEMARLGSMGGKVSGKGGFWHRKYVRGDVEFVREQGKKGGLKSKRRYNEGRPFTHKTAKAASELSKKTRKNNLPSGGNPASRPSFDKIFDLDGYVAKVNPSAGATAESPKPKWWQRLFR